MTKPMTIEDVLCVYLKNLEEPFPTCFEFHENKERMRAAILAFAAEQVAQYKQDAERYAFAKTIEGQALVIKVFFEIGAQGLDPAIDTARARAQEE